MSDLPIIFSAPMIASLLAGRKKMTRRLAKTISKYGPGSWRDFPSTWCRVRPGDRLWVRETWKPHSIYAHLKPRDIPRSQVFYAEDPGYAPSNTPWVPPIHMPRWMSRITLVVTATKTERLQEIDNADAISEGCGVDVRHPHPEVTREPFPVEAFRNLWSDLHGAESWDANPEIIAISFIVHKTNIDAMPQAAAA